MQFRESAWAKVNLTLSVLGRRGDGYHDIESLVAFAGVADQVELIPDRASHVTTSGPFAASIEGPNLLEKVLALLKQVDPALTIGAVALEKNLPVAAGLGGGSADAAALLRAARKANPDRAQQIDWHRLAARLGADVPVCLAAIPAIMRGIGEEIEPLEGPQGLPSLACVLVNPRTPLPTAAVFGNFAAPSPARARRDAAKHFPDVTALLEYMRRRGNDLEPVATKLYPAISRIKAEIGAQSGCRIASMSGSGPTCFGIFEDVAAAGLAAKTLLRAHPGWWVVATRVGSPADAEFSSHG
jgi:4-diphosphocytidyl-2-C-methyl-D-erythritol kinase